VVEQALRKAGIVRLVEKVEPRTTGETTQRRRLAQDDGAAPGARRHAGLHAHDGFTTVDDGELASGQNANL
jgi:hypothetical protein